MNAIDLLKQDHREVERLSQEAMSTREDDAQRRSDLCRQIDQSLRVHTRIEEAVFYPMAERLPGMADAISEAKEEHHLVDRLLDELSELSPNDPAWMPTFRSLVDNFRHHVQEEENRIFPSVSRQCDPKQLDQLSQQLQEQKQQQQQQLSSGRR